MILRQENLLCKYKSPTRLLPFQVSNSVPSLDIVGIIRKVCERSGLTGHSITPPSTPVQSWLCNYDVDGVDDPRDVSKHGQQQTDPEFNLRGGLGELQKQKKKSPIHVFQMKWF